jgi:V/A-type H+-transporting ATPase subunit E
MTGLDKITSRIIADAEADAKKILAEAEASAAGITASYEAKAEEIRASLHADAEREATDIISRAKSAAAMDKRNILLTEKSRLIDGAFSEAKRQILAMPDDKYLELLAKLLTFSLLDQLETERINRELYGETDMPDIEKYEVIVNKSDRERFGKSLIDSARRMVVGKVDRRILDRLVLSDSTADIEGGVILKYGDVESNSSIEMILDSIRNNVEPEVCKILFG